MVNIEICRKPELHKQAKTTISDLGKNRAMISAYWPRFQKHTGKRKTTISKRHENQNFKNLYKSIVDLCHKWKFSKRTKIQKSHRQHDTKRREFSLNMAFLWWCFGTQIKTSKVSENISRFLLEIKTSVKVKNLNFNLGQLSKLLESSKIGIRKIEFWSIRKTWSKCENKNFNLAQKQELQNHAEINYRFLPFQSW